MNLRIIILSAIIVLTSTVSPGGEKTVVSLRDFSGVEIRSAGIELPQTLTFRIVARGADGSQCDSDWKGRDRNRMFAYGWILNADTRQVVWEMTRDNTSRARDDRTFDGEVTLERGSYEVYFAATTFTYITAFKNLSVNIDHREPELFNHGVRRSRSGIKGWFEGWFSDWFGDDLKPEWLKRSKEWGIDLSIDESKAGMIKSFTPPREMPDVVFKATRLGESEFIRRHVSVTEPVNVRIYALGEGFRGEVDLADYGWLVNNADRTRVWEMKWRNGDHAGGASKNIRFDGVVSLSKGDYTLYYVTDDSHSDADWNCGPPSDPLNYGITVMVPDDRGKSLVTFSKLKDDENVIVNIVKVGDNESRSEGFTLKQDTKVRIYAIGERSNSRRVMADYAMILDARTRQKVWTMDADNTFHAGGASKNRFVDDVITLPKGNYIVQYNTDDSHAYGKWNSDPPFDVERYGVTIFGVGEKFDRSVVGKYVDERDKNVIAQIIRVRDNERKNVKFKLDKTTRIRVYALGEGQNREMYDYGWITDARTGMTVWEMTYSMTFHAGGARKNRMVNTSIMLERGEYMLHYQSDDSHSHRRWNMDPPEDQEYWGITLYPDEGQFAPPVPPVPPPPVRGSGTSGGGE